MHTSRSLHTYKSSKPEELALFCVTADRIRSYIIAVLLLCIAILLSSRSKHSELWDVMLTIE